MTFSLQTAVVGTGFIGPIHVEALARAGVRVRGILGSSPEKSAAAARSLGLPHGYASLDEVLSDPAVDVVHLTTPNRLHFQQAKASLRAGKHVMCEKPLAMNSAESLELVQLAAATGLVAAVAYNTRFYPLCHESAARIASPDFGDVWHVTGSYTQDWLLKKTDFNWRVLAEEGGSLRAVADIGTHWLDLMQFLTGQRVVAVCADLQTVHPIRQRPIDGGTTYSNQPAAATEAVPVTTEDAGSILLRFSNGAKGCLHVSQTTAGRKNCLRFEIAGGSQSLAWNSEQPNSLWTGHRDCSNQTLLRDPSLLHPSAAAIANYPGGHNEGFSDTFKQLFRTFYEYVSQQNFCLEKPFPTFQDGHREILLCEAILQSHLDNRWVEVAEA